MILVAVTVKCDVSVPHGKAATETLMLTTVVSLASDDTTPARSCREQERQSRWQGGLVCSQMSNR